MRYNEEYLKSDIVGGLYRCGLGIIDKSVSHIICICYSCHQIRCLNYTHKKTFPESSQLLRPVSAMTVVGNTVGVSHLYP